MTFLRIVAYEDASITDDQLEIWDEFVGRYLRDNPDCVRAKAARSGNTMVVLSEWTSQAALERDKDSAAFQAVVRDVAAKINMSPDITPDWMFEGDVLVNIG
ncbi:MAG: hypothetical protein HKN74_08425 [Acidimicrobiia bacterium]|nr:antibiotic biosynthesis monooxygenase [Acidimicrobiia bacterium]MBT8215700.1 antibiotic biosynthesis monooxygenase [Acidimicrobiia bacterium]NNF10294.1 hypothetical protein [Acidimicrobiia bacterium]NNL69568.1 hypothetical protein [Acidimicrobiia bacterium]